MRSESYRWWCAGTLVFSLISGCQEMGLPTGLNESTQTPEAGLADAEAGGDLAAEAYAHAQRVAAAGAFGERAEPMQEILWSDVSGEPQADPGVVYAESAARIGRAQRAGVVTNDTVPPVPPVPTDATASGVSLVGDDPVVTLVSNPAIEVSAQPGVSETAIKMTQAQAHRLLLEAVRRGDDSNLSKAITAATLATVGPHGELDWSMLASLSPKDKQRVEGYHRAISTLRAQMLSGEGELDREAVAGRLEALYGSQPVTIRTIELCEKVMGYGVYDAFPDHTFVAGREQKLIVYVELDHFKPMESADGEGYEVRLRQELELYESNGFEVWSHEPVQITDVSHNKRRDFFVVQLVTLPAQLRMGQYHLKIRVYDENAGTRDEATLEIRLVADDTLVKKSGR